MTKSKELIQYPYAIGKNGDLVHIDRVTKTNRDTFYCPNCGDEMIAGLGDKISHYFRHVSSECSNETYIHSLAKEVFLREYISCLEQGLPFLVRFGARKECTHCNDNDVPIGPCHVGRGERTYDLTNDFKEIYLEKYDDGFRPDLLLKSRHGRKVYIEIAVTHYTEAPKLKTGITIIEIPVKTTVDLSPIFAHDVRIRDGISFFNASPAPIVGDFRNNCNVYARCFWLWEDTGKSLMKTIPLGQVETPVPDNAYCRIFWDCDEVPTLRLYQRALFDALQEGHHVKNCYLCRYSIESAIPAPNKVFCTKLQNTFAPNDASNCSKYSPGRRVQSEEVT